MGMLRERDVSSWPDLRKAARKSPLGSFAALTPARRSGALRAALMLPWSMGPVEGHIHWLKLIKRQMYGRAKLDLLRDSSVVRSLIPLTLSRSGDR